MDPYIIHQFSSKSTHSHKPVPAYGYDVTLDRMLGSTLFILSTLGISCNLFVLLAVRVVTKKNCSKARLASSIFIFNLSLSDALYSAVLIFSAVTMLIGGRSRGISEETPFIQILCNFTGILFNLTVRTSLWFLTMLTLVRYLVVLHPLKAPHLITKRRVKVAAIIIWTVLLLLALVPYPLTAVYQYVRPVSVCIWTLSHHSMQARLGFHLLLMVVPIVIPGLLVIILYLQIVWKVIQLKTIHHKLKCGNVVKEDDTVPRRPEVGNTPQVEKTMRRISAALSNLSSSVHFLKRPLSLIELDKYEKDTEIIDQDLMEYAISSLSKSRFKNGAEDTDAVVAYYVNSFIVKTGARDTFERIQSHSFAASSRATSYLDAECPISLSYYDCKNTDQNGSKFRIKLDSDEAYEAEKCVPERSTFVPEKPMTQDMSSVVVEAMKQLLDKDIKDIKDMNGFKKKRQPSFQRVGSLYNEVAIKCQSNSIMEETTLQFLDGSSTPQGVEVTSSTKDSSVFRAPSNPDETLTITDKSLEDCSTVQNCVNGVCSDVQVETTKSLFRLASIREDFSNKNTLKSKGDSQDCSTSRIFRNGAIKGTLKKSNSLPCRPSKNPNHLKLIKSETEISSIKHSPEKSRKPKIKTSLKRKICQITSRQQQDKRINRLDIRLRIIIRSAFYTLLMVTQFIICYMLWWLLSIDITIRYLKGSALIKASYTTYCNLLTISYSTILLSACSNPVIYFYFAYKKAMLDALRLKYRKFRRGRGKVIEKHKR